MSFRSLLLGGALILGVALTAAYSVPGQAEGYCARGHHFDEAKGLCYDPQSAYRPNVPRGESVSGGVLPGLAGLGQAVGGRAVLCQYGDRLVGSGDQAYCVSRVSGKPYPAGR